MGRFDPIYTNPQRQAVIALIVDQAISPTKACKQLQTNGHDDVEPFDIPVETARKIAHKARLQQAQETASENPATDVANSTKRLITLAMTEIGRMEHQSRQGKLDTNRLGQIARVFETLDKLAKTNKPASTTNQDNQHLTALADQITNQSEATGP